MSQEREILRLPEGTMVGRYRLQQVQAAWGFYLTYFAEDPATGRQVLLHELLPEELATRAADGKVQAKDDRAAKNLAWARERFLLEGRGLAACVHPAICPMLEVFEAKGTAYWVTPVLPGQNLKGWLESLGRAPTEAELRSLLVPILSALEQLHGAGLFHLNLKLETILVAAGGKPILVHFAGARQGIARHSHEAGAATAGYSPIEQYDPDKAEGPWTDIYSLGAVLYRAIYGRVPPEAPRRLESDPYQRLAGRVSGEYGGGFLRAIDAALSPAAVARPQSIAGWRQMLDTQAAKPVTPPRRSPALVIACAAGVALLLAVGVWQIFRPKPTPPNDDPNKNKIVVDDSEARKKAEEEKKKIEEQKKAEEEKAADEKRKQEEQKLAEEQKKAEEERKAAEKRAAEAAAAEKKAKEDAAQAAAAAKAAQEQAEKEKAAAQEAAAKVGEANAGKKKAAEKNAAEAAEKAGGAQTDAAKAAAAAAAAEVASRQAGAERATAEKAAAQKAAIEKAIEAQRADNAAAAKAAAAEKNAAVQAAQKAHEEKAAADRKVAEKAAAEKEAAAALAAAIAAQKALVAQTNPDKATEEKAAAEKAAQEQAAKKTAAEKAAAEKAAAEKAAQEMAAKKAAEEKAAAEKAAQNQSTPPPSSSGGGGQVGSGLGGIWQTVDKDASGAPLKKLIIYSNTSYDLISGGTTDSGFVRAKLGVIQLESVVTKATSVSSFKYKSMRLIETDGALGHYQWERESPNAPERPKK